MIQFVFYRLQGHSAFPPSPLQPLFMQALFSHTRTLPQCLLTISAFQSTNIYYLHMVCVTLGQCYELKVREMWTLSLNNQASKQQSCSWLLSSGLSTTRGRIQLPHLLASASYLNSSKFLVLPPQMGMMIIVSVS